MYIKYEKYWSHYLSTQAFEADFKEETLKFLSPSFPNEGTAVMRAGWQGIKEKTSKWKIHKLREKLKTVYSEYKFTVLESWSN